MCTAVSFFFNPIAVFTIAGVILGTRALSYPAKLNAKERAYLDDMAGVKWTAAMSILVALAPLAYKGTMTLMAL
jgi:hypothetical protein